MSAELSFRAYRFLIPSIRWNCLYAIFEMARLHSICQSEFSSGRRARGYFDRTFANCDPGKFQRTSLLSSSSIPVALFPPLPPCPFILIAFPLPQPFVSHFISVFGSPDKNSRSGRLFSGRAFLYLINEKHNRPLYLSRVHVSRRTVRADSRRSNSVALARHRFTFREIFHE